MKDWLIFCCIALMITLVIFYSYLEQGPPADKQGYGYLCKGVAERVGEKTKHIQIDSSIWMSNDWSSMARRCNSQQWLLALYPVPRQDDPMAQTRPNMVVVAADTPVYICFVQKNGKVVRRVTLIGGIEL